MNEHTFPSRAEKEAAKAAGYPDFGKLNLAYVREGIENILKLIGRDGIFDEYTLHDMTHIDAMLELLDTIVPAHTAEIMTPADWLLIVLACYFHDLGMLVTKKEYKDREKSGFPAFRDNELLKGDEGIDYADTLSSLSDQEREKFYYQEFVRDNHADRVFHWVMGHAKEELGASHQAVEAINGLLDGLDDKLREDLAVICRSHHGDDLDNIDHVFVLRRAYGQPSETHANLQYSALLLRTVDLLQIQRSRVPSIMYKTIDPGNPKSQEEWAKQAKVRAILTARSDQAPDGQHDTIEVQAVYDEASGFFGLDAYLQFARDQLKQSYEWSDLGKKKGSKHDFPWRYINDDQVEARGFLPQRYEFSLDRRKILTLLTGHTLYNDSTVAIREIIQNAIDTVRFRDHAHKDEPLGAVRVEWDSKSLRLSVVDNGDGMERTTLEKHLLNVGSSYYQEQKFKDKFPDFSPISKFGIGVLSYFMISNDVEILTVHEDEECAHQVSLPSATQRYLIKTLPKDHADVKTVGPHGTRVTLKIRPSAGLRDLGEIVRYWIVLPECEVTLAVDDAEPLRIGFSSTREALQFYVGKELQSDEKLDEIKIETSDQIDGIDLAYATRFSRWFRVWNLVTRRSFMLSQSHWKELSKPPGVCVEGIRVSSSPPGYSFGGLFALANLTGTRAPRTNVARSDLEQTSELKSTFASVYEAVATHIEKEFGRIRKDGRGTTAAAIEADLLTAQLLREAKSPEDATTCIESLRILLLEDESGRRLASRNDLAALGSVCTAESPPSWTT